MIRIIKEMLKKGLDELSITQKIPKKGQTHKVYFSKSNPNIMYKVGTKDDIDGWINIFKENPKYFPKVYRIGQLRNNDDYYYVEVEKLDADKSRNEWVLMEKTLDELEFYQDIDYLLYLSVGASHISEYNVERLKNALAQVLEYKPEVYQIFMKWIDFLKTVKLILLKYGHTNFDSHKGNFGYDSAGNIKCLDI